MLSKQLQAERLMCQRRVAERRVIHIFPNSWLAIRLLGALFVKQDAHWSTDKRYWTCQPIGSGEKIDMMQKERGPTVSFNDVGAPRGQGTETF
jgi:hypothetical protein